MKVRPFTAARAAAGTMLLAVTVAACTGGTPVSSAPSIFTPSPTATPTGTSTALKTPTVGSGASAKASRKPSHKATVKPKPSAKSTATVEPTITIKPTVKATATPSRHRATADPKHTKVPVARPYPTGAPETGGGGTSGLQDGLLFGVGGAAIFAGLGSLGYRRRLRRKQRAAATAARTEDRKPTAIR